MLHRSKAVKKSQRGSHLALDQLRATEGEQQDLAGAFFVDDITRTTQIPTLAHPITIVKKLNSNMGIVHFRDVYKKQDLQLFS